MEFIIESPECSNPVYMVCVKIKSNYYDSEQRKETYRTLYCNQSSTI